MTEGPALRIVFAGTPEAAVPSLRALLATGHQVVAVITRPDARRGRGRALTGSPVADAARATGIMVLQPVSVRSTEFREQLDQLKPDLGVVVAYGAILPPPVLETPRLGWVNLHFSVLPAWRGAAPVQAAIAAGDEITGATTFRLVEGLDDGPVYGVVTEPIRPDDTAGSLLSRLAATGSQLLVATVEGLADGSVTARPQPTDGISLAGKITTADAEIDWKLPALVLQRRLRALTPDPGPWTDSPWGRLRLGPATATDVTGLAPAQLQVDRRQVLVGTGSQALRLGTVIAPGKREMPAADWARGARVADGSRLGAPAAASPAAASPAAASHQHTAQQHPIP